ncbi:MAG: hypothetical protein ACRC8D_05915, partial [Aeromonas sp.]
LQSPGVCLIFSFPMDRQANYWGTLCESLLITFNPSPLFTEAAFVQPADFRLAAKPKCPPRRPVLIFLRSHGLRQALTCHHRDHLSPSLAINH